jgi:hypothetical protein
MDKIFPVQWSDETTLLHTENALSRTSYLRGVIGKLELTLHPMIPAGSEVQIDTRIREISPKKDWTHEFGGPSISSRPRTGISAAGAKWMKIRSGPP